MFESDVLLSGRWSDKSEKVLKEKAMPNSREKREEGSYIREQSSRETKERGSRFTRRVLPKLV